MRVGIVCEGTTDYEVLQVVVQKVLKPTIPTFTLLVPDEDRLAAQAGPVESGWQAVRKFLQTSDTALDIGTFDVVVVHVDADIEALVEKHLARHDDDEPGGLDALCRHVKSWIGGEVPANVVIVLPRTSIEAWLVALHTRRKNVEAISQPAEVLADEHLLLRRGSIVEKRRAAYRKLAETLPDLIQEQRRLEALPELERFVGKVARRQRDVRRAQRS